MSLTKDRVRELAALIPSKPKANKYHAVKTEVDGILFDSGIEADYYLHLRQLQRDGEVVNFDRQPVFELQPAYVNIDGKKVQPIRYKADFLVRYADGSERVIDVKGFRPQDFRIKQKMFGYVFRHDRLVLVSKKKGKWVEWA